MDKVSNQVNEIYLGDPSSFVYYVSYICTTEELQITDLNGLWQISEDSRAIDAQNKINIVLKEATQRQKFITIAFPDIFINTRTNFAKDQAWQVFHG